MDGKRFDQVTRLLASTRSRRGVLGILGSAFAGLLAGGTAGAAPGGQKPSKCYGSGSSCTNGKQCCSGTCTNRRCTPEVVAECVSGADCPGVDTECQVRTCVQGRCGLFNMPSGTVLATQTSGDCKTRACDGNGGVTTFNDDTDIPSDGNQCTADVCTNGVPSHPNSASGIPCNQNGGTICNGGGTCVVDPCAVVDDNNDCTADSCVDGSPVHSNLPAGSACTQNGGSVCNGSGLCVGCVNDTQCPAGQICGGGGTPNTCGCTQTTCLAEGKDCGTITTCGEVIQCGSCSAPQICGGSGRPGVCGICVPGSSRPCYTGPAGSLDVGICMAGTETCNQSGSGYGACVGEVLPGSEINCNGRDDNCNGIVDDGAVCPDVPNSSSSCVNGQCVLTCDAGFANCDSITANGCEINITTSVSNCGACNRACPSGPNSIPFCQGGVCGIQCFSGFANCNGNPFDGCETNLTTNPANCGACGRFCPNGAVCQGAQCCTPDGGFLIPDTNCCSGDPNFFNVC